MSSCFNKKIHTQRKKWKKKKEEKEEKLKKLMKVKINKPVFGGYALSPAADIGVTVEKRVFADIKPVPGVEWKNEASAATAEACEKFKIFNVCMAAVSFSAESSYT